MRCSVSSMATIETTREPSVPGASGDHLYFLDLFRGVAIICVFAYHALFQAFRRDQLDWSGRLRNFDAPASFLGLYPVTWGWCGVAFFFVVSGFCIHLSHARAKDPSVISFLIRRWFRIYPPFLAALLFFVFVFPHTRLALHSRYDLGQLLSHLLLLHNLDNRTWSTINVAWWSVAVEFQLYLLYPLLLAAARRFGWHGVLVITAVIEIGLRLGGDVYQLTTNRPLPALLFNLPLYFWFSWTMGAAIAEAYVKGKPLPFMRSSIGLWLALFIAADLIKPLHEFSFTFAALITAIVIARLLSPDAQAAYRSMSFLPRRLIDHVRLAGVCSYSIYLIHLPIVEVWPQLVRFVAPAAGAYALLVYAGCLASWAIILPLSWIMYRYVERPAIAMGKRIIQTLRSPASPVARFS
jgi:peptidoglycan/LPS O-acetylase OafA/YrhL